MSNKSKPLSQKIGFWKRLALTIEAMEKTEIEHIRDEIAQLRTHQSEIKKEIHNGIKP